LTEQENQETEGATQQGDVTESYELLHQQLKEANETIATLQQKLFRKRIKVSYFTTLLLATLYVTIDFLVCRIMHRQCLPVAEQHDQFSYTGKKVYAYMPLRTSVNLHILSVEDLEFFL